LAAYDGQQAIELARRKQPDLIVLDLMLPQVDGMDMCRIMNLRKKIEPEPGPLAPVQVQVFLISVPIVFIAMLAAGAAYVVAPREAWQC